MKKAKDINADFISYAERAFAFNEEDKSAFVNKVINFIKIYKINTLMSLDIRYKKKEVQNKQNMNLYINDKGEILYEYTKHNLIPFVEYDYFPLKEPLKALNTEIGRFSTVICYDINYPIFINSLSRNHLDVLIVPSWDYPGVAEFQSKEARYKAIEGGFNLIKNTANGVVIASDYKGRILTYFSGENCQDYFVVTDLYKHGVKTLYSYIGQYFNFNYLITLIIIVYFSSNNENNTHIEEIKKKKKNE
jgi:apolipoprotein N-acyltransferase